MHGRDGQTLIDNQIPRSSPSASQSESALSVGPLPKFVSNRVSKFLNGKDPCQRLTTQHSGLDQTNFSGRDRDREIILMKIHYETETEKKWMLNFLTR